MVFTSVFGNSSLGLSVFRKNYQGTLVTAFAIFLLHCYSQVAPVKSNHHIQKTLLYYYDSKTDLNRNEKVTVEKRFNPTTKLNLVRHKQSCLAGRLYCTQCPNFSRKSQNDLIYHIAKKHGAPELDVIFQSQLRYQEFPGFCALPQHKGTHYVAFLSGQQLLNLRISLTKLMYQISKRSCVHVNTFPSWSLNSKCRDIMSWMML